jgi:hypothetical protein
VTAARVSFVDVALAHSLLFGLDVGDIRTAADCKRSRIDHNNEENLLTNCKKKNQMSFELTFDDEPDIYDSRVSDAIDALTSSDVAAPSTPSLASIASPYLRVESPTSLSDEFGSASASRELLEMQTQFRRRLRRCVATTEARRARGRRSAVDLTVQTRIVSARK